MRQAVLAVVVSAVVAGVLVSAQNLRFRSTSDLVRIYATVTRGEGQYVRDLTAADFRVSDNGTPREIEAFSNDVQPITVALVVDQSGTMINQITRVGAAAQAFVNALLPDDRASFSTLTHIGVGLTSDKRKLMTGIRTAAQWDWWDAGSPIWGALDRSMTELSSEGGRRVLVIITDGEDTPRAYTDRPSANSQARPAVYPDATGDGVSRRALREEFMLYALGFEGSKFEPAVKAIARQSGGGFNEIGPAESLSAAFTDIVDDLHRQYLIGFVPVSFDGRTHTIKVECLKPGTTVRARESYFSDVR